MSNKNVRRKALAIFLGTASVLPSSGYALAQSADPALAPRESQSKREPEPASTNEAPALELPLKLQAEPPPAPAPASADAAADTPPVPNTDSANGPPEAALNAPEGGWSDESSESSESSWSVDKGDNAYFDFVGAWGWENRSYLATFSFLNMYLHEPGDTFGFHARMLALGALSFEQTRIVAEANPSHERRTTFMLGLIDPSLRLYIAEPVFVALGFNFGLAFYDSVVPTLDVNGGLGFQYAGWGLEAGLRSSRLPRDVTAVNGNDFVRTTYDAQLYVALETNVHLF